MSGAAEQVENKDAKAALLAAARTVMARDGGNLTIRAVCTEAGISRTEFNNHFLGKVALVAALVAAPEPVFQQPPATEALRPVETVASEPTPVETPTPPTDAWLERRLRVFERALTALEAKAEASNREHARTIALLEERLVAAQAAPATSAAPARPAVPVAAPVEIKAEPAVPARIAGVEPEKPLLLTHADPRLRAALRQDNLPPQHVQTAPPPEPAQAVEETPIPEIEVAPETGMVLLLPEAPRSETISREEMAEVLASARKAVRDAADIDLHPKDNTNWRLRWIAAGICLAVVFGGIGLMMGGSARATAQSGTGVVHRQLAAAPFSRLMARADSGDAKAEAQLAFAYLRGQGVASNVQAALRWASEAASHGEPVAQYLLGTFYQGQAQHGLKPDPARAFQLFSASAAQGNIKAMHNLAIAYAEGLGTDKDEAKAAQWFERAASHGYVDSAFDLAVLYERGLGVPQSLKDALRWYSIAAMAGDHASADRAAFLRHQVSPGEAVLAANAAASFSPLAPIGAANTL